MTDFHLVLEKGIPKEICWVVPKAVMTDICWVAKKDFYLADRMAARTAAKKVVHLAVRRGRLKDYCLASVKEKQMEFCWASGKANLMGMHLDAVKAFPSGIDSAVVKAVRMAGHWGVPTSYQSGCYLAA
jgi:hypothetical protein